MRWLIVLMMMAFFVPMYANQDDADRYVREAGYYQKKADGYRREAAYYLKKAEQYERDAAYYTKKWKTDTAKSYQRRQNGQLIVIRLNSGTHQVQMRRLRIT